MNEASQLIPTKAQTGIAPPPNSCVSNKARTVISCLWNISGAKIFQLVDVLDLPWDCPLWVPYSPQMKPCTAA